jgi:hypothetical protein
MWPEKATAIVAAGRSLQELKGIGLSLTKRLHGWIVSPATFEVPVYSESYDVEKLTENRGRRPRRCNLVASNQVYRGVRQSAQRLPRSTDIGPMMHSNPFVASL